MPLRFSITRDHLATGDIRSVAGRTFSIPSPEPDRTAGSNDGEEPPPDREFRLYDPDGELYFEGLATPGVEFEPLDWAEDYAGATEIRYRNTTTGVFEPL